jgi:hypothetical protein
MGLYSLLLPLLPNFLGIEADRKGLADSINELFYESGFADSGKACNKYIYFNRIHFISG